MLLDIRPLDGCASLSFGEYGLSLFSIAGLVEIKSGNEQLNVHSLSIKFSGRKRVCTYAGYGSVDLYPDEVVFETKEDLLSKEVLKPNSSIEIPFQIYLPEFKSEEKSLPASLLVKGSAYRASVEYFLSANSCYTLGDKYKKTLQVCSEAGRNVCIPFKAYNPKHVLGLLYAEPHRWRSIPGLLPLEYDIQVGNMIQGLEDLFRFRYCIRVSKEAAKKNVRISKVLLLLKECHTIGYTEFGYVKKKVKCSKNVLVFEQKARDCSPITENPRTNKETGLQVYSDVYLKPKLNPTTKSPAGNKKSPCIEVTHKIQVKIELLGLDSITMESGCFVASISKKDCFKIHEMRPEILPSLDYEKYVGLETWVPGYDL